MGVGRRGGGGWVALMDCGRLTGVRERDRESGASENESERETAAWLSAAVCCSRVSISCLNKKRKITEQLATGDGKDRPLAPFRCLCLCLSRYPLLSLSHCSEQTGDVLAIASHTHAHTRSRAASGPHRYTHTSGKPGNSSCVDARDAEDIEIIGTSCRARDI